MFDSRLLSRWAALFADIIVFTQAGIAADVAQTGVAINGLATKKSTHLYPTTSSTEFVWLDSC